MGQYHLPRYWVCPVSLLFSFWQPLQVFRSFVFLYFLVPPSPSIALFLSLKAEVLDMEALARSSSMEVTFDCQEKIS